MDLESEVTVSFLSVFVSFIFFFLILFLEEYKTFQSL